MGINIRQKYYFIIEIVTALVSFAFFILIIYWVTLIAKEIQGETFYWKLWFERILFLFGAVILYHVIIRMVGYDKVSISPICYSLQKVESSDIMENVSNYFAGKMICLSKEREEPFYYLQNSKKNKHINILLMEMEKFDRGSFKLNQWRFSRMMNKCGKENRWFLNYLNIIIVNSFNDQVCPILFKNVRHANMFTILACLEEKKLYVPAYFGAGHFIRCFLLHNKVYHCFSDLLEMNSLKSQ